jgi:hypothetical protein
MPANHKVGDKIRVSMHGGNIVDAVIKAVINKTDGPRYQDDFGFSQTALIREWQICEELTRRSGSGACCFFDLLDEALNFLFVFSQGSNVGGAGIVV